MSIDDRLRLNIHTKLTELLGAEEADAVIHQLTTVPWQDVATKDDLRVFGAELRLEFRSEMAGLRDEFGELRGEFAELRGEWAGLRGEWAELRGEFAELRGEFVGLRGEFVGLRGDMHGEIAALRGEMRSEFGAVRSELHQAIVGQTRWLMGYVTAMSAGMLAVARLVF